MNEHFEQLMERVAYLYFACKTFGLVILIDLFVFKKPAITLFVLLVAGCYYGNLKLFTWLTRYSQKKKSNAVQLLPKSSPEWRAFV